MCVRVCVRICICCVLFVCVCLCADEKSRKLALEPFWFIFGTKFNKIYIMLHDSGIVAAALCLLFEAFSINLKRVVGGGGYRIFYKILN